MPPTHYVPLPLGIEFINRTVVAIVYFMWYFSLRTYTPESLHKAHQIFLLEIFFHSISHNLLQHYALCFQLGTFL